MLINYCLEFEVNKVLLPDNSLDINVLISNTQFIHQLMSFVLWPESGKDVIYTYAIKKKPKDPFKKNNLAI